MSNLEKITSDDFRIWLESELNMGYLSLADVQKSIQAFRKYNNADKAFDALSASKEKRAAKVVWVIWKKYGSPQKALEAFKGHYNDAEIFVEEIEEFIKNNPDLEDDFDWEINRKGKQMPILVLSYQKSEYDDSVHFYKKDNKYYFDYTYITNITHSRDWHGGAHGYEDVYNEDTDNDGGGPFDSLQAAYENFIKYHLDGGNFAFYHKEDKKYENYFDGEGYYDTPDFDGGPYYDGP